MSGYFKRMAQLALHGPVGLRAGRAGFSWPRSASSASEQAVPREWPIDGGEGRASPDGHPAPERPPDGVSSNAPADPVSTAKSYDDWVESGGSRTPARPGTSRTAPPERPEETGRAFDLSPPSSGLTAVHDTIGKSFASQEEQLQTTHLASAFMTPSPLPRPQDKAERARTFKDDQFTARADRGETEFMPPGASLSPDLGPASGATLSEDQSRPFPQEHHHNPALPPPGLFPVPRSLAPPMALLHPPQPAVEVNIGAVSLEIVAETSAQQSAPAPPRPAPAWPRNGIWSGTRDLNRNYIRRG